MTRLFIRFYIGVIAILVGAWLIQSYVFRQRSEAENVRVVERALSGGARLARDELEAATAEQAPATFRRIEERFDYPVQVFDLGDDWLSDPQRSRLQGGEVVFMGSHVAIAAVAPQTGDYAAGDDAAGDELAPQEADRHWGLILGPLPQFVGPSQAEITFGYGIVFLLAAIAIAILLRPVVSQLHAVERTAAAITQGDLSARIDSSRALKGLALVRAFNTMADRTETSLRSQRELLQGVSHELRTPLARIRFAADLVETATTDEERRTRLDAIDSATQKLDDLVGELLTYVRLDSDTPESTEDSIDLQTLLAELIEIHAPLHPSVEFSIEDPGHSIRVTGNRASLSRAVENLLSNAGRFARASVSVLAGLQGDGIVIHVDDDGAGVPETEREKIFEPFVRLEDSGQRGAGLGLALVNRIARRHGGQVTVTDSPSGGARFSLQLPA
jgi:signal transduction histidine kinase